MIRATKTSSSGPRRPLENHGRRQGAHWEEKEAFRPFPAWGSALGLPCHSVFHPLAARLARLPRLMDIPSTTRL